MVSIINKKGMEYFDSRIKDLRKYYYFPFFIIEIPIILLILLFFRISNSLIIFLASILFVALTTIYILRLNFHLKRLNKTISDIKFNADESIEFGTFKVFFHKSIDLKVKKENIQIFPKKFIINKKEQYDGWVLKLDNNIELYLFKDFFDQEIINRIAIKK